MLNNHNREREYIVETFLPAATMKYWIIQNKPNATIRSAYDDSIL